MNLSKMSICFPSSRKSAREGISYQVDQIHFQVYISAQVKGNCTSAGPKHKCQLVRHLWHTYTFLMRVLNYELPIWFFHFVFDAHAVTEMHAYVHVVRLHFLSWSTLSIMLTIQGELVLFPQYRQRKWGSTHRWIRWARNQAFVKWLPCIDLW